MRNAKSLAFVAMSAVLAVLSACSDRRADKGMPTAPQLLNGPQARAMGTCTTLAELEALAVPLFGAGTPNYNSVRGKLDNLAKKVAAGNATDAADQANNIVSFIRDKAAQGQLLGTSAQVNAFIAKVLCFAGLSPDTFLIQPTDDPQVITTEAGTSGVSLDGNTVDVPTLLTITTLDSSAVSLLDTRLDQYPTIINITTSSPITKAADVAVCPLGVIPSEVLARLRLGHQAASGFEITPPPEFPGFLDCNAAAARLSSTSRVPGWLRTVASLIIPKPLFARQEEFGRGGVGGSVTEFSPFDAVDPELSMDRGGVGGSVTEFKRTDPNRPRSGTPAPVHGPVSAKVRADDAAPGTAAAAGASAAVTAGVLADPCGTTVGTEVSSSCRPSLVIRTRNGTLMQNVQVDWAVDLGNGRIAPAGNPCGTIDQASLSTTTDASGATGICWQVGPEGGINTVRAIPRAGTPGSDVPAGARFFSADSITGLIFAIEGLKITPGVTATGGSFVFSNAPVTGSGSCTNGLTPTLSYSGGSAPTDVGTYTLTVTCGGGNVYNVAIATASITITAAATTTAVSCSPASIEFDGTARTPCSSTVSGPGTPAGTPTIAYANNVNAGTATATATYAGGGNWQGSTGTATFAITKAPSVTTVSCPASTTYTGSPLAPCTASVFGVAGLTDPVTPVTYAGNVDVGTASATASYAGGENWQPSTGTGSFAITKATSAVSVTCSGTPTYSGAAQTPCTAVATGAGSLSVGLSVSYSNNVVAGSGTATASATYAGDANHTGNSNSTTFSIAKAPATATAGNATMNFGAAVPAIPCTVTGLIPADAGAVTCTTSVPPITLAGAYPTIPLIAPTNPANYSVAGVNGMLTVAAYVQNGCFASPVFSVMPETKSAQRKGSNLPIKCALTTPQGVPVTNATGNIQVVDAGTAAVVPPVKTGAVVFSATNVFKYSNSGNYAYGLDTGPSSFVVGHYYYVIATWNDGSKTEGWFLLK